MKERKVVVYVQSQNDDDIDIKKVFLATDVVPEGIEVKFEATVHSKNYEHLIFNENISQTFDRTSISTIRPMLLLAYRQSLPV